MKMPRFWWNAAGAALACLGFQFLQAHFLQEALRQQDQVLAHRLEVSMAEVLNEAHRAKDDLALYHVMHALQRSPGVLEAQILKPGGSGYPLHNNAGEWGRLHLSTSDRLTRQLIQKQRLISALALGVFWALLVLYFYGVECRSSDLRNKLDEFQALLEAEKRQLARSEEREQQAVRQGTAALQQALQRIADPIVVLNPQQRIWAMNEAAVTRLQIDGPILQKSWHEIPLLDSCGPALEQSLASPGQSIEWCNEKSELRLEFKTAANNMTGTWILFL